MSAVVRGGVRLASYRGRRRKTRSRSRQVAAILEQIINSMDKNLSGQCALVTGGARRVGAAIVRALHAAGASVAIHHNRSADEANALAAELNAARAGSATLYPADLLDLTAAKSMLEKVVSDHGRLDALINNASTFYATPLESINEADWNDLVGTNLKAPLFLSSYAAAALTESKGSIVNIIDIHADRPLGNHSIYGSAKAGLAMLTRSLAKDLAPAVRVNGVAPGAVAWPENGMSDSTKQHILGRIPLARQGQPEDIAGCVLYLVKDAHYVTGQIIAVDGGRSIGW